MSIEPTQAQEEAAGTSTSDNAAPSAASAAAAAAALYALSASAEQFLCYTPPTMEPSWHPGYAKRLEAALKAALDAGMPADQAYAALSAAAAELPDGGAVPWPLLRRCVAAGLHADVDAGGGVPLLHYLLLRPYPPPLSENECSGGGSGGSGDDVEQCPVTLAALLETATPDLPGPRGATAAHLLIACLLDRVHFPADSSEGEGGGDGGDGGAGSSGNGGDDKDDVNGDENESYSDFIAKNAGAREFLRQAAADARRAAYARGALRALFQAGWSPGARNGFGNAVTDALVAAQARAAADLAEVRDSAGLPRAALGDFVAARGGGRRALEKLVAAHEAGALAVEAAVKGMAADAAAARRPAVVRTAAAVVAVWAALVALAWYWLVFVGGGRR